jgi:hypothetical protein
MKSIPFVLASLVVCLTAACASPVESDADQAEAAQVTRPPMAIVLNDDDAQGLEAALSAAGAASEQRNGKSSVFVDAIECSHAFVSNRVVDACNLQLPASAPDPRVGFARPAMSISIDGRDAKRLMRLLTDAGVQPLQAIEGTSLSTGKVSCSSMRAPTDGILRECSIALQ